MPGEKSLKSSSNKLRETFLDRIYREYIQPISEARVKKLYAIGAKVYDPLMRLWNMAMATEAEKELSNFLRKNIDENRMILELGCGAARNLQKIYSLNLKFKRYLGLDFSSRMLAVAGASSRIVQPWSSKNRT